MLQLTNDKHVFKWVDEAFLDEIEFVAIKAVELEEYVNDIKITSQQHRV